MSAFDDAWPALFHVKHDSGFACSGLEHKWSSLLGSNLMPKRNLSSQPAEGFHALGAPPEINNDTQPTASGEPAPLHADL